MAGKGGKTANSGRKTKVEEEKVNFTINNALKTFYNVATEEEAKEKLVHTLMESQRGQIFIAEHLLGKPKETIEQTHNINDFNIKDIFKIGNKS